MQLNARHKLMILMASIALFAGICALSLATSSRAAVATTQLAIPNFSARSLVSEKELTQALFYSKGYQLLNVWASWCGVCKREHDELLQLAAKGVPIIGLHYRDQAAPALAYLQAEQNPYWEIISDPKGALAMELGVIGTPEMHLIDSQGKVVLKYRGELTAEDWNDVFAGYFNVRL